MNHETKKQIEAALAADELSCFNNDFLVDVFCVWDCYRQEWISDSPILLRFESDDVVVRRSDEGVLEFMQGPIDNTEVIAPYVASDPSEQCLCWLRI